MIPIRRLHASRVALAALATLFLVGPLTPTPVDAKRLFVPRQYKRLQAAIDAAAVGDTIWVSPGTYKGPFVLKKRLVLFGEGGPTETILDGGDSVRVLHVEGVVRGGIYGFRIQRGKAPGGSGIYCLRDTTFAIESCDIRSNWEAGVAVWQSVIRIADSEISENKGSGLTASDSEMKIFGVTFRSNHGSTGGGISLVHSVIQLATGCLFEDNRADGGTGGAANAENSLLAFMNCTFKGNTSAVAGGALAATDSADLRIRSSVFTANRAATGGAVLVDHAALMLQTSIFNRNRATAAGAAIQILGRRTAGVNPSVYGNTFYRNGADAEGGAIFAQEVSPEIVRNIFVVDSTAKNKAVLELKSAPRYECNLIHTLDGPGDRPSGNTVAGDPAFCDPEKGDFHLRDLSPALVTSCGKIGALGKGCVSFKMAPSH